MLAPLHTIAAYVHSQAMVRSARPIPHGRGRPRTRARKRLSHERCSLRGRRVMQCCEHPNHGVRKLPILERRVRPAAKHIREAACGGVLPKGGVSPHLAYPLLGARSKNLYSLRSTNRRYPTTFGWCYQWSAAKAGKLATACRAVAFGAASRAARAARRGRPHRAARNGATGVRLSARI